MRRRREAERARRRFAVVAAALVLSVPPLLVGCPPAAAATSGPAAPSGLPTSAAAATVGSAVPTASVATPEQPSATAATSATSATGSATATLGTADASPTAPTAGSPDVPSAAETTPTAAASSGATEATATATVTATVTSATEQPPAPPPVTRPATAPAVQSSSVSVPTLLIALGALVVAGLVIVAVARRPERPVAAATSATGPERDTTASVLSPDHAGESRRVGTGSVAATPGLAGMLVALGEAMIDAGDPVASVQTTLRRAAEAQHSPGTEVIVLPTALFVSVPGEGATETAVAVAGASRLRLDQVEAVSRVAADAELGVAGPAQVRLRLAEVRATPPPYGVAVRTLGYVVLSVGLAMILRASVTELVVAAVLGAMVGALQVVAPRLSTAAQGVLPVVAAFGVSLVVFLLARTGLDVGVFAPLVAPLVTFLPGALLTTAMLELSTGQMISGGGRLAAGAMQLVLLAIGIVGAAQLVGLPATVVGTTAEVPMGDVAPWVGVALFGIGVVVHHCATRTALPWVLLVLYVAYGAQVVGGLFVGAVLSAFVGAVVMAPVAVFVAAQPSGPPTQVSFLPAFWLLVPGALGLVGVTQLLGADPAEAFGSLLTTGATMIGIALGVLIGLGAGASLARRVARVAPSASAGAGGRRG